MLIIINIFDKFYIFFLGINLCKIFIFNSNCILKYSFKEFVNIENLEK